MRLVPVVALLLAVLVAGGDGGAAPEPTGQLLFTTDAAADGSRELHLVSLDGSPPTRLTTHEPRGYMPSYSPDGNSILFVSFGSALWLANLDGGDALWLANLDGHAVRRIAVLTEGIKAAVWSPDGRTIAVVDGGQAIWLIDTASGKRHRVRGGTTYVSEVTWSPDGSRLAVSYSDTETSHVSVLRPDGGASRRITPRRTPADIEDEFYAFGLKWAPDGSAVAYSWGLDGLLGSEIRVASVGGGGMRKLGNGDRLAWSSDGRRVAFANGRSMFVVGRNGRGSRRLAVAPAEPYALTWSSDGKTIGFLAGNPPLHGVDVGSGRIRTLARPLPLAALVRDPSWSPRGDAAASGVDATFLASIGTRWRRVLRGASDSLPSWSRDGGSIAFQRAQAGRSLIMLLRLGGTPRVLGSGRAPQLAPDGTRVAFYRGDSLFVWSGAGNVLRVGLGGDGVAWGPDGRLAWTRVAWSPDGTRLAWTLANAVYVAPSNGGAARLLARNKACDADVQGDADFPAWSPDGRTIAFVVTHLENVCRNLAIVSVGSGHLRSLGEGTSAGWSPDGTGLAVHDSFDDEIRVVGVGSGSVLARWRGGDPSWSPDGLWVAYSRWVGEAGLSASHVYVRRRDGTGGRQVTTGVDANGEPRFRPATG